MFRLDSSDSHGQVLPKLNAGEGSDEPALVRAATIALPESPEDLGVLVLSVDVPELEMEAGLDDSPAEVGIAAEPPNNPPVLVWVLSAPDNEALNGETLVPNPVPFQLEAVEPKPLRSAVVAGAGELPKSPGALPLWLDAVEPKPSKPLLSVAVAGAGDARERGLLKSPAALPLWLEDVEPKPLLLVVVAGACDV